MPRWAIALVLAFVLALLAVASMSWAGKAAAATTLPSGFREEVVVSGLTHPTAVQFSPDGRLFVAEKSGLIKVFDGLDDATPTTFADLRTNVHDFWDRGLLGLALNPNFPATPYVYALYTHNAQIGGTAPRWPDACPNPPGATGDGCVVSGRLSRLEADGDTMTGSERVLIEDWCQQYPSHSVGSLAFGADRKLYVGAGDGASFNFVDYGQDGDPTNPCGDPPTGVGGTQKPPTAEGGALRSQDLRTSGDPAGLGGTILRVEPGTGEAAAGNPFYSSPDPNARRVVAYGLRNPFRFAVRPGTNEIWLGDVGWGTFEEVNRVADPADPLAENFGWPCYEGPGRQGGYDGANLSLCENLYGAANAVTAPFYAYNHGEKVVAGETCPTGSSSIAGMAFYEGGSYPDGYDGALFFADYSRKCIWAMREGANGLPDPSTRETFLAGAANPVGLQVGPGGNLFYVDLAGGTIRRIRHFSGNQPPTAVPEADPTRGDAPLGVSFDGSGSSDPDPGDRLSYAWDLDGDGQYDDSTSKKPRYTYDVPGNYTARLRVTDGFGESATAAVSISVGNAPPAATIDAPPASTRWKVGDVLAFSGSATDPQDGNLPASALSWALIVHHCSGEPAGGCHEHPVQTFEGVSSGSFVAPDHEYPSHLELRLTATDSSGSQDTESVRLDPQTVELTFRSDPSGLRLVAGGTAGTTPFGRTVISGSKNSISAPTPQTLSATNYEFSSWSDGGAQSHDVVAAGVEPETYTATFASAAQAPLITAPADNSYVNTSYVTLSGTVASGAAGGSVEVFEGATSRGTTPVDAGGTWQKSLVGVPDGSHTYTARLTDGEGNTSAASDERTVIVDTGAPDTGIVSGPSGTVRTGSASFGFAASEAVSRFECSLDGAAFAPCASPKSYSGLASKPHSFRVQAVDRAGNVDATPATRTWTVDTVPPTVTSPAPAPGASTRDRTPTIGAVARDTQTNLTKANVGLYLDGRRVTTFSYSALSDRLWYTPGRNLPYGRHTARVVATDAAGNVAARSWGFRVVR